MKPLVFALVVTIIYTFCATIVILALSDVRTLYLLYPTPIFVFGIAYFWARRKYGEQMKATKTELVISVIAILGVLLCFIQIGVIMFIVGIYMLLGASLIGIYDLWRGRKKKRSKSCGVRV